MQSKHGANDGERSSGRRGASRKARGGAAEHRNVLCRRRRVVQTCARARIVPHGRGYETQGERHGTVQRQWLSGAKSVGDVGDDDGDRSRQRRGLRGRVRTRSMRASCADMMLARARGMELWLASSKRKCVGNVGHDDEDRSRRRRAKKCTRGARSMRRDEAHRT